MRSNTEINVSCQHAVLQKFSSANRDVCSVYSISITRQMDVSETLLPEHRSRYFRKGRYEMTFTKHSPMSALHFVEKLPHSRVAGWSAPFCTIRSSSFCWYHVIMWVVGARVKPSLRQRVRTNSRFEMKFVGIFHCLILCTKVSCENSERLSVLNFAFSDSQYRSQTSLKAFPRTGAGLPAVHNQIPLKTRKGCKKCIQCYIQQMRLEFWHTQTFYAVFVGRRNLDCSLKSATSPRISRLYLQCRVKYSACLLTGTGRKVSSLSAKKITIT